jgi:SAM-dependent methyltransferase
VPDDGSALFRAVESSCSGDALAQDLVARHGIAGGAVLEIGCGQGEFLLALRRAGVSRAWGYDPAYDPAGSPAAADPAIVIAAERYEAARFARNVDLICCGMTFAHETAPRGFLREIAATPGTRTPPTLFIRVPNGAHIVESGAFWEIHYTRFAYYTSTTLARLLETAGYGVMRAWTESGDQKLMMEARPQRGSAPIPARRDPAEEIAAARRFASRIQARGEAWRRRLEEAVLDKRAVALWGAGADAVGFLALCGDSHAVTAAIDSDPRRRGTFLPGSGIAVVSPEDAAGIPLDHILVLESNGRDEVAARCGSLGIEADIVPVEDDESTATGRRT